MKQESEERKKKKRGGDENITLAVSGMLESKC